MEKILPETLADLRKELDLLMEFGAPAAERDTLAALVDRYAADLIALKVFRSFYSYLPEAQDDGIVELRRIANHQGVFLLCAKSRLDDYLYLADREQAEFLGTLREGIWDPEILAFFGWPDREAFLKTVANPGRSARPPAGQRGPRPLPGLRHRRRRTAHLRLPGGGLPLVRGAAHPLPLPLRENRPQGIQPGEPCGRISGTGGEEGADPLRGPGTTTRL